MLTDQPIIPPVTVVIDDWLFFGPERIYFNEILRFRKAVCTANIALVFIGTEKQAEILSGLGLKFTAKVSGPIIKRDFWSFDIVYCMRHQELFELPGSFNTVTGEDFIRVWEVFAELIVDRASFRTALQSFYGR